MLITVQQNPSWQLSLAQLSPSLYILFFFREPLIADLNTILVFRPLLN